MAVAVTMPKLGLTMTSGRVIRWLKSSGDAVIEGEPLVEIETEKIAYEIPAPASGTLVAVVAVPDEEFACGATLAHVATGHADAPAGPARASAGRTIASPAARRLARQNGVALERIERGSGPRGRIVLADVPGRATPAPDAAVAPERRAIHRKMTAAGILPIAAVEHVARVDEVRRLMERRGDFGWTAFFAYACARLLVRHPQLRVDATTAAPVEAIDVGIAVDTERGLVVPVVRGAASLTLAQTHARIADIATRARAGRLAPGESGAAAFSISNVGPQGIDRVAPLVDPPQTAILGVGRASARPFVDAGSLVVGDGVTLVLSFDHRYVDGAPAARFLHDLVRACASPGDLL